MKASNEKLSEELMEERRIEGFQKIVESVMGDSLEGRVLIAASLIKAVYACPGCEVGGPAHVVIEDGNMEDSTIDFCLNLYEKKDDQDSFEEAEKYPECYEAALKCLRFFKDLTGFERAEAYHLYWNYFHDK